METSIRVITGGSMHSTSGYTILKACLLRLADGLDVGNERVKSRMESCVLS